MLYHFELQMAGVILLTGMLVCGISLWLKRRKDRARREAEEASFGSDGEWPAAEEAVDEAGEDRTPPARDD